MKRLMSLCAVILVLSTVIASSFITAGNTTDIDVVHSSHPMAKLEETSVNSSVDSGFITVAENDRLKLYAVTDGKNIGEFMVLDKSDNKSRYSNPQNRFTDNEPFGNSETEIFSQFVMTVYDGNTGTEEYITSYDGTKSGKTVSSKLIKDGISFLYKFNDYKISMQVDITLNGRYVNVSVPTDKTVEIGAYRVISFSLLPYFGCTDASDSGYMMIPDGSGAIIYNNNGKTSSEEYYGTVYGKDDTYLCMNKASFTENVYLPVFGTENEKCPFFAVIEDGAAESAIRASVSGMKNDYNTVFSEFKVYAKDNVVIGNPDSSKSVSNYQYDFKNKLIKKASVNYLCTRSGNGYNGMAKEYREYLGLKDKEITVVPDMFLQIYGGIKKQSSFLGIPVKKLQKLTTVKQAYEIVQNFSKSIDGGVVLGSRYFDGAVIGEEAQDEIRIKNDLGSTKELESLKKLLNNELYIEYDPSVVVNNGNGFNKYYDSVKRIGKDVATVPQYKLSTLYPDKSVNQSKLLNNKTLEKLLKKYLTGANTGRYGVGLYGITHKLYTDFAKDKFTSRSDMQRLLINTLKSSKCNTVLESPNAYLFGLSDKMCSVPMSDSQFDIEDEAVPFYTLVLNGSCEYCTESINLSDNIRDCFLKAAEVGGAIQFSFVYDNAGMLGSTRLQTLYGADYKIWRDKAENMQKELEKLYTDIGSRKLVENRVLSKNVHLSVFDNGKKLVVNFSTGTVQTEYGRIEAENYKVIE